MSRLVKSALSGSKIEVAVGVDVDASGAPGADLRPAVDGEAGDEIAAGLAVAAGEVRRTVRLDRVALSVQLVARRIDHVVLDRQREAVVGQRIGETEHQRAGGRLTGHAERSGLNWTDVI